MRKITDALLKQISKTCHRSHAGRMVQAKPLQFVYPQDFVYILNKMRNEFGMERIKEIFPTGGEGTISSYKTDSSLFMQKQVRCRSGLPSVVYTSRKNSVCISVL
jgi:hypothetical protein